MEICGQVQLYQSFEIVSQKSAQGQNSMIMFPTSNVSQGLDEHNAAILQPSAPSIRVASAYGSADIRVHGHRASPAKMNKKSEVVCVIISI